MSTLLSVAEAQVKLLSVFSTLEPVMVPIDFSENSILAETVFASCDLPMFDNSGMDGFAVRDIDTQQASPEHPVNLDVIADIPAGQQVNVSLAPGKAARIMTGAPIPDGANAVIPVENTDFNLRQPGTPAPATVKVFQSIKAGENIRVRGQDVRFGEAILPAGQRLRPQDIGMLATLGIASFTVIRKPRVAIFSSGDELLPVQGKLTPGKIYDSNSSMLLALVNSCGAEAIWLGIARDNEQDVRDCLEKAVKSRVDLIISSAGVSVGAFDFVKNVVEQGGRLDFWRVNMRPGKPLAFGNYQDIPFVGLPGNPVSAFVGFEVFIRPALRRMGGLPEFDRKQQKVILEDEIQSDGRESFLRAIVRRDGEKILASLTGHQGSGNLRSLVQANALLLVASGVKSLPIGSVVDAWLFE